METLERTLTVAESVTLDETVMGALDVGDFDGLDFPGLNSSERSFLLERLAQFHRQCQFLLTLGLGAHPCVRLGEEMIPVSFSPEEIESQAASDTASIERALVEAVGRDLGTEVELLEIVTAKRSFVRQFAEFLRAIIGSRGFGGGGSGGGGGGDRGGDGGDSHGDTSGMEIVVNSNTHGLQVVYSENFMIRGSRSENAFGETLTSPTKGRIARPGLYYFGTADNEKTNWARFRFEIPPTRIVNLMH